MVYQATGANIRNILAAVRRANNLSLEDTREVTRSGGEDQLYRVHLANGDIVECTVVRHSLCLLGAVQPS